MQKQDDILLSQLTSIYSELDAAQIQRSPERVMDVLRRPPTDLDEDYFDAWLMADNIAQEIPALFMRDDRFPGDNVRMICLDAGRMGFYPNFIGAPMVRALVQKRSPRLAIEWLQKVLSTTEASGSVVCALWGLQVSSEVRLTPHLSIVPINDIPESRNKTWLSEHRRQSSVASALDFTPVESAIVARHTVRPFIAGPDDDGAEANAEYVKFCEMLNDVSLALTVVGPRVVTIAAQWLTLDDPDLELAINGSFRRSPLMEVLPLRSPTYPVLEGGEAKDVVQAFLGLSGEIRNKVRIALKRLSLAQYRHGVGDQCVELATAFETILSDGGNSEMTHKVKVRSVRLLGGSTTEREHNAAVMAWIYNARSKLVHTGIDETKNKQIGDTTYTPQQLVDDAIRLCADRKSVV